MYLLRTFLCAKRARNLGFQKYHTLELRLPTRTDNFFGYDRYRPSTMLGCRGCQDNYFKCDCHKSSVMLCSAKRRDYKDNYFDNNCHKPSDTQAMRRWLTGSNNFFDDGRQRPSRMLWSAQDRFDIGQRSNLSTEFSRRTR